MKKNWRAELCFCFKAAAADWRMVYSMASNFIALEEQRLESSLLCNLHSFHFCFSCGSSEAAAQARQFLRPGHYRALGQFDYIDLRASDGLLQT